MSKRVISLLKEIVLTIAIELLDIAPLLNVAFRVHSAVCVKNVHFLANTRPKICMKC